MKPVRLALIGCFFFDLFDKTATKCIFLSAQSGKISEFDVKILDLRYNFQTLSTLPKNSSGSFTVESTKTKLFELFSMKFKLHKHIENWKLPAVERKKEKNTSITALCPICALSLLIVVNTAISKKTIGLFSWRRQKGTFICFSIQKKSNLGLLLRFYDFCFVSKLHSLYIRVVCDWLEGTDQITVLTFLSFWQIKLLCYHD